LGTLCNMVTNLTHNRYKPKPESILWISEAT
jgi:hypothetical protein